jgi:hypothetical protein
MKFLNFQNVSVSSPIGGTVTQINWCKHMAKIYLIVCALNIMVLQG